MTTTTSFPSTVIAVAEPAFTNAERLALAGFLAGYTGLTRDAYALDLRQYAGWPSRIASPGRSLCCSAACCASAIPDQSSARN